MRIREAVLEYSNTFSGIETVVAQMRENLSGTERLTKDGQHCTVVPIPIAATEPDQSIAAGIRAVGSNRLSRAVLAFSINYVGETPDDRRLAEVAEVVQAATQNAPFASTFFTESYPPENGTMGNIRARLQAASSVALMEEGYHLSRFTPVIIGDIDILKAGTGLLPGLAGAVQRAPHFAQAAVIAGYSGNLHAAGLLPPNVSFPNMDRVLYFYNAAILACEYATHGMWNAILLGDYLDIHGYDITKLSGEDLDLQERLLRHIGQSLVRRLPPATGAFAVAQQRRYYARLQSGHSILDSDNLATDFSTVDDICRGKPYEDFRDISVDEADVAVKALWSLTGEVDRSRTLGDSIVWWRCRQLVRGSIGYNLGRNPSEEGYELTRPEVRAAYQEAKRYAKTLFARVQHDYAYSRETT